MAEILSPAPRFPRGSQRVKDGDIWCEGCRTWFPNRAAYHGHRPACPHRAKIVDARKP